MEFVGDAIVVTPSTGGASSHISLSDIVEVEVTPAGTFSDGVITLHGVSAPIEALRFPKAYSQSFAQLADAIRSRLSSALSIPVTTGHSIPGRNIVEIVDVISAEAAMGMHIFKDLANSWRDAFGGRSKSLQGVLREARQSCLSELRSEASAIGADAVIGVDLDYSEFSSSMVGGGMVFVVATGTAVRTEKAESAVGTIEDD